MFMATLNGSSPNPLFSPVTYDLAVKCIRVAMKILRFFSLSSIKWPSQTK